MASKTTLNAANLETLGAERLAQLLIEVSEGNAGAKRRLRLELVGAGSPAELAAEVRKRIATIGRSRTFVDWQKRKALIDDLESQRRTIIDKVAKRAPAEGLELMWRFVDLAESIYERSGDSSGAISGMFQGAIDDLGTIAQLARPDPIQLADQVFDALNRNGYGQFNELIDKLRPALGTSGLERLKQRMIALAAERVAKPSEQNRHMVRSALKNIADAQGDVDAYMAQYDASTRTVPTVAAAIARRLLQAGRNDDAWRTIEATAQQSSDWTNFEWEDARIAVLEAVGRNDEAQAARWSCFERSLSKRHLRENLAKLPDFDDFDAEQRALDYAERFKDPVQAIMFLIEWPAVDRAAGVVTQRAGEIDGNQYEFLTPAADALAGKYPLAATLTLRTMIDFTLTTNRVSRYGHAARHLRNCEGLAASIRDHGAFLTHDAYVARLRQNHSRKAAFWSLVG